MRMFTILNNHTKLARIMISKKFRISNAEVLNILSSNFISENFRPYKQWIRAINTERMSLNYFDRVPKTNTLIPYKHLYDENCSGPLSRLH